MLQLHQAYDVRKKWMKKENEKEMILVGWDEMRIYAGGCGKCKEPFFAVVDSPECEPWIRRTKHGSY